MKIPIWQVDAFAGHIFAGNPAAVCVLDEELPGAVMGKIAAENNLAETAFVQRAREGGGWSIRWFTPAVEVDLCGHATLAAAFVLFSEKLVQEREILFHSKSGLLKVSRQDERLLLDFPARPPRRIESWPGLEEALGVKPRELWLARDLLAVLETEEEVRNLLPDMARLARLEVFAVCVTAPGSEADFVSRFFAPGQGIPEDPVTGSAHCSLAPYWAGRLGRNELKARQVSPRGGELHCRVNGDRVEIGGRAALFLRGEIFLDADR